MGFVTRLPRGGARRWLAGDEGVTLIELLVATALTLVIAGAAMTALLAGNRSESRDEAYSAELTSSQTSLARLTHDLRQATSIVTAQPNVIEFLMPLHQGSTLVMVDVRYDCTASDSVSGLTRCARTQAVSPASPSTPPATAGSSDIQHVQNGMITTYCKSDGTAASGSVFFYGNPSTTNPDSNPPACDENYQNLVAQRPSYVQVLISVPASGGLTAGGMSHSTVLSSGVELRNWNLGATGT
jgi:hypothetical protein